MVVFVAETMVVSDVVGKVVNLLVWKDFVMRVAVFALFAVW